MAADHEVERHIASRDRAESCVPDGALTHTTLGRYFERPEVAKQLKQAAEQLGAAQRALPARRTAERRQEQELRRKAGAQAAAEREQARRARAAVREITSRGRGPRSDYEACA